MKIDQEINYCTFTPRLNSNTEFTTSRDAERISRVVWLSQTLSSSHMASLISNLSSTIARLTLLRKPPIRFSTKSLKKLQLHPKLSRPVVPFLRHTTDFVSVHYSSCPKAQTIKASSQDEELVVLGIETSCDDTAAAVVSFLLCVGGWG